MPNLGRRYLAMRPADLAAERDHRRQRELRHLAHEVRQAAIHATDAELIGLHQLVADCQAQTLTAQDARAYVARLRDDQRGRTGHLAA